MKNVSLHSNSNSLRDLDILYRSMLYEFPRNNSCVLRLSFNEIICIYEFNYLKESNLSLLLILVNIHIMSSLIYILLLLLASSLVFRFGSVITFNELSSLLKYIKESNSLE